MQNSQTEIKEEFFIDKSAIEFLEWKIDLLLNSINDSRKELHLKLNEEEETI